MVMEVSSHALALHRVAGMPLRRRRVHQPRPRPPRPPRHAGALLRGQGAAVRAAICPSAASSTSTILTAGCWSTSARSRPSGSDSATSTTSRSRRPATATAGAAGAIEVPHRRCVQRDEQPRRGHGLRAARASTPATIAAGLARRAAGARPVRSRCVAGQPFAVIVDYAHTPDGLREGDRRRTPGGRRRRRCHRRVRLRRRPRSREAPADGRRRRRRSPITSWSPPTTPLRGPAGDHRCHARGGARRLPWPRCDGARSPPGHRSRASQGAIRATSW